MYPQQTLNNLYLQNKGNILLDIYSNPPPGQHTQKLSTCVILHCTKTIICLLSYLHHNCVIVV